MINLQKVCSYIGHSLLSISALRQVSSSLQTLSMVSIHPYSCIQLVDSLLTACIQLGSSFEHSLQTICRQHSSCLIGLVFIFQIFLLTRAMTHLHCFPLFFFFSPFFIFLPEHGIFCLTADLQLSLLILKRPYSKRMSRVPRIYC